MIPGAEAGLARALAAAGPGPVGLAVSGGSDSTALLHLALAAAPGRDWRVVTVDHGLRPEAAAEAAGVARAAAALDLPHETLRWTGWDGSGNLQDAARRARQSLIGDWARRAGIAAVCLGHTMDDQAETVLMRLARGSGVDGLSGMSERRQALGILWLRPLLGLRRAALRDWLAAQGIGWVDDPSNADPRFDRVRARRLLADCAGLGISAEGLAATASRMAAARDVLGAAALAAAERLASVSCGAVTLAPELWQVPDETRWRLIAGAACFVSGNPYRPRLAALQAAEAAAREGRNHTLHGCLMLPGRAGLRIQPEPRALAGRRAGAPGDWEGWRVTGPAAPDVQVAALGQAGLAQMPQWRDSGLPRVLAEVTPGLWRGEMLVAAPVLAQGDAGSWRAVALRDRDAFMRTFISH
ncbi:tRNA lysidine(34) synthetase TilS [Mangrovicoccus algicola]|uniref:tRNA(Ile)-lysidine synthase n=1 Tax=Mangrovicoccus algicola TaxID=2771008 RepID=A0A8J6Z8Q9_9RHOB|nr:tRNA lysidine(34) synthetase TilS [Mangrovicoccus algicola]MBE3639999.1 tRNA lysidine(34) synthetase TilS [Mangrovicoccus algicola]